MADLDAELLALAGGDSSDEGDSIPNANATKQLSPPLLSNTKMNEASTGKANSTLKASSRPHGSTKSSKKSKLNESEEEGEAYDLHRSDQSFVGRSTTYQFISSSTQGSPNSLQSAPMSESNSDSSAKEVADTEKPMFPIENKFYSEKDKAHIISLSEIERESILAERAQLLERKLQDQHLRRLLQARENTESRNNDKKKRKAATADLEDSQRKSSRQKTTLGGRKVGETSSAMKEYKRQLEQKGIRDEERRRQGEERRDRKGRASIDDGNSDADADGESEVEWDDGKPKASEHGVRKDEPAELIDLERVRIGRDNFGKVCFYPGFDEAIKNCFARVSIGVDKVTGENIYRVAQIKGMQSS